MPQRIKELVTNGQKIALAAIKNVKTPDRLVERTRNALANGCLDQSAYIQFGDDLPVYGLWEALLYAENYEIRDHAYVPGTVMKAFQTAIGEPNDGPSD